MYVMDYATMKRNCKWCGNRKEDHGNPGYRRCAFGFTPTPKPNCRVCGSGFDPGKSGREDCCYRHRMDS